MTEFLTTKALQAAERGWIPEPLLRLGIRRLCAERLALEGERHTSSDPADHLVDAMSRGPVAVATEEANTQHYEQPTALFTGTLGPRLKYSCCFWPEGVESLREAEVKALEETCRRARLSDGMDILELGCGWGSLTLWLAANYPHAQITAVSNSQSQRLHIEAAAGRQGLKNIRVITANMNTFDLESRFDRVLSVEMFEHMNNYRELFSRISNWMKPDGLLFVHVFAHKRYAYKFESNGAADWMARNFFTGGVMPSENLLTRFQEDVRLVEQWWWSGEHYRRTAEAWLDNMTLNKKGLMDTLESEHGRRNARVWYQRWRMFYLACAELWGYGHGQEWGVAHYLFERGGKQGAVSA